MNLRPLLLASTLFLFLPAGAALAGRNHLKPIDFVPITTMPWEKEGATFESVLDDIFREPDVAIRYPVLFTYLNQVSDERMAEAFDKCVALEGTQTPDELVAPFLSYWAQRDPATAWDRTRQLFHITGIESGWLGYDSWKDQVRITVQDVAAIRASPYWLRSATLACFPLGTNDSDLPKPERIRLMKAFTEEWFQRIGTWPGAEPSSPIHPGSIYPSITDLAEESLESLRSRTAGDHPRREEPWVEMARRCWMQAEPKAALEIVDAARKTQWLTDDGRKEPEPALKPAGPSLALLMIWAKVDREGIIRWADQLDPRTDETALDAMSMLLSTVDDATRQRWLAKAKLPKAAADQSPDPEQFEAEIYRRWAAWDPEKALDAATATKSAEIIGYAFWGASYSPFDCYNARHFGLGVIQRFPLEKLPKETLKTLGQSWDAFVMEPWGDIDIGENARHGLQALLLTDYAPREKLIQFFGGDDIYGGEDGLIDRTFCALRVWAVVRPDEMKVWLNTMKDAEMKKALTWLMENPWGSREE